VTRDGWRTIETAPKDGTVILLADWDGTVSAAYWSNSTYYRDRGFRWANTGSLSGDPRRPICWIPLPAAPIRDCPTCRGAGYLGQGDGTVDCPNPDCVDGAVPS
jgi:hypothetical protein